MVTPCAKTCVPSASSRKLDWRAIDDAADRRDEMAEQAWSRRAGRTGSASCRRSIRAGSSARRGALAGAAADVLGGFEVAEVARRMPAIVALHVRPGRRRRRSPSSCSRWRGSRPTKPWLVAMAKVEAEAEALPPFELVTPVDGARGVLGGERAGAQLGRVGIAAIVEIEVGGRCRGTASPPARARHIGPRALRAAIASARSTRRRARRPTGRTRRRRRSSAEEQAQADLLALGAADVLERAEAHPDRGRAVADIDRVGGVGAVAAGLVDEGGDLVAGGSGIEHGDAVRPSGRRRQADRQETEEQQQAGEAVRAEQRERAGAVARVGARRLRGEVERGGEQGEQAPAAAAGPPRSPRPSRPARARSRWRRRAAPCRQARGRSTCTPTSASSSISWIA